MSKLWQKGGKKKPERFHYSMAERSIYLFHFMFDNMKEKRWKSQRDKETRPGTLGNVGQQAGYSKVKEEDGWLDPLTGL